MLKVGWIGVGLRMEIVADGRRIVTTAVRSIVLPEERLLLRPHRGEVVRARERVRVGVGALGEELEAFFEKLGVEHRLVTVRKAARSYKKLRG